MEKAVQVGLIFPRSGQQVQVSLPTTHAERLGLRFTDDQPRTTSVLHPNRANQAHEATKHA